jgi:hypothetical protein
MNIHRRIAIEKAIYARIVQDALIMGYKITVFDGEEDALEQSSDYFDIIGAGFSTDMDALKFYDHIGYVGFVSLIYGNTGWDVVSDYTASDRIEAILKGAEDLADYLERTS